MQYVWIATMNICFRFLYLSKNFLYFSSLSLSPLQIEKERNDIHSQIYEQLLYPLKFARFYVISFCSSFFYTLSVLLSPRCYGTEQKKTIDLFQDMKS